MQQIKTDILITYLCIIQTMRRERVYTVNDGND